MIEQTEGNQENKVPEVEIEEIAATFSELQSKFITGDLPRRPFWLKIGDASFKVTDENRYALGLGMHLCLSARCHLPMF